MAKNNWGLKDPNYLYRRFRWVFCQLEFLHRCLPARIRQASEELPESLDETYERTLQDIFAHRIFQAGHIKRIGTRMILQVLQFACDCQCRGFWSHTNFSFFSERILDFYPWHRFLCSHDTHPFICRTSLSGHSPASRWDHHQRRLGESPSRWICCWALDGSCRPTRK